jgi:hypothetical protein
MSSTTQHDRIEAAAKRFVVKFPHGPDGAYSKGDALAAWERHFSDLFGADERTARASQQAADKIDRAYLRVWLSSEEGKRAEKARPGFGLPGVAVLPDGPRQRIDRDGTHGLRVIGNPRRTIKFGTPRQEQSRRANLAQAVKRLANILRQPILPEEASAVILHARTLRHEAESLGVEGATLSILDRAIRRAREAQYSARPA